MLDNCHVLSDHVLRPIGRWDLLLSFCLRGGSGCEDVLSEIALLDKIFKILAKGSTLRSSMSLAIMKRTIFSHSGMSRVICFCLWMLHPGLSLGGFEDVLDWKLQRGKAVGYLIGLGLALLRV